MAREIVEDVSGFRPIVDHPDSLVNDAGTVVRQMRGGSTWFVVKTEPNKQGYPVVILGYTEDGKRIRKFVHRAVLETFVGPCPEGMECCHCDGDRANCHLSNLRWDTRKGNFADMVAHGTRAYGEKHHHAKLTSEMVLEMRKLRQEGVTLKEMSRRFGMAPSSLSRVILGKRWPHLPGASKPKTLPQWRQTNGKVGGHKCGVNK